MKVTIETTEVEAKKMLFAIDENKELKMSMKALIVELEKEQENEKYDLLVEAIKACTHVFSTGGLYYIDNKEAQEIIKGIL